MFKFLHAADIHLDSPLKGLQRYEGAPIEEIRGATRQALCNLVQLAIDQKVNFVLIAGDLYDGDWRDHLTGLFFVSEMARLRDAGIPVFLISGNHDAANRMTRSLRLPENVFRFSTKKPETHSLDDFGVSIHGQGFDNPACSENLARAYPPRIPAHFNIGLLHTSAAGSQAHAAYAECGYDDLRAKEYDYWALGHIHQRSCVWGDRRIHFSGNIQGRHVRETGAKGCLVVTVDDRHEADVHFEPLDVLRWERSLIDASNANDPYAVVEKTTSTLAELVAAAGGRPIAVRLEVTGGCRAHERLVSEHDRWTNEIRAAVHDLGRGNVWIEKVKFQTSPEHGADTLPDEGPLGELIEYISQSRHDEGTFAKLSEELTDLARRLPGEFRELDGFGRLDDPESLLPLLEQVQPLLVGRLLDRQSAQGRH
jgi:exonuclease SbcD